MTHVLSVGFNTCIPRWRDPASRRSFFVLALAPLMIAAERPKAAVIYETQQAADRALAIFDRDNPDCELWTDWQRLCSRTGPQSSRYCKATVQKSVRPSAPFCVAKADGGYRRTNKQEDSAEAIASSRRFCSADWAVPPDSTGSGSCMYSMTRPFSGRDLNDRAHPWCSAWREAVGSRPTSINRRSPFGYYCAIRSVPSWCVWADGLGYGGGLSRGETEVIPILENPDGVAVRGVFCRRRGTK